MTPARFGPVELGKLTCSPMVEIYLALDGARKVLRSKGVAVTSAIVMIAKLRDGGRPERLERPRVVVEDPETPELGVVYCPMLDNADLIAARSACALKVRLHGRAVLARVRSRQLSNPH
jgi:hypothetical protein